MRRLLATTAALAAAVLAAGLPAGSAGARSGPQASAAPAWLAPSRLESAHGRLKRAPAVQPVPEAAENGWRRPASAADLTARDNVWRTQVIRPAAQTQSTAPASPAADDSGDFDAAVVAQTNAIRSRQGLVPLKVSPRLRDAAERHSRNMGKSGFFAHESADGTAFWKRVQQFYPASGAGYWAVGENLIWSSPELSVEGAMRGWMDSPGHRANILEKDWREIGCFTVRLDSAPGVYGGRKVAITTCDFGVRR